MKKHSIKEWCKKNKKKIIVLGSTIAIFSIAVLGVIFKNHSNATPVEPKLADNKYSAQKVSPDIYKKDISVSSHTRTLTNGRHASEAKIAQALENGIGLSENSTYVNGYVRNKTYSETI